MVVVFPCAERVTRRREPLSTFLQSQSVFFYGVFLVEYLLKWPTLDVMFRPAVLSSLGSWFHGGSNPIYMDFRCIPAASVVSSSWFTLISRTSVAFFIWFVGLVLPKVAVAPTTPARKLSVVSSFPWERIGSCRMSWPSFPGPRTAFRMLCRLPSDRGPSCVFLRLRVAFAFCHAPLFRRRMHGELLYN
jgi:hypothetical protein